MDRTTRQIHTIIHTRLHANKQRMEKKWIERTFSHVHFEAFINYDYVWLEKNVDCYCICAPKRSNVRKMFRFHGKSTRFGLFLDQQTKGNSEKYKFLCFSRYAFSFTTISFVAHELVRCRIQFLYSNEIILHNIKANEAEKKNGVERKRLAIYYIKLEFKWLH